jgi:hypothetical protein
MQQRFETFTVLIAKISRSIRRIKAEEMSEFHLKGPHVSCLYYLTQLGPLTAGQLCDRCEEDKAAVSRSLEYLEQNEPTLCDQLMLVGTLLTSCSQVGRAAQRMVDKTLRELMQTTPMPDRRANPLGWTQMANSLKKQAEEAVLPMLYKI